MLNLVGCTLVTEEATAKLQSMPQMVKVILSLSSNVMMSEMENAGFASKLREIPAGQLRWLKKSQEMWEQFQKKQLELEQFDKEQQASVPSSNSQQVTFLPFSTKVPYSQLQNSQTRPNECDPANLEKYLTQSEFNALLTAQFYSLPLWKQQRLKREKGLF